MMRPFWGIALLIFGLLSGCSPETEEISDPLANSTKSVSMPPKPCGSPMLAMVRGDGPEAGVFEVMNDSAALWFSYTHPARYKIREVRLFCGENEELPLKASGSPNAAEFPLVKGTEKSSERWEYRIPLTKSVQCFNVSFRVELENQEAEAEGKRIRAWAINASGKSSFVFNYCLRSCKKDTRCQSASKGDFMTIPPALWNERSLFAERLQNEYQIAFPQGLELGCVFRLDFDKGSAAAEFLAGKTPMTDFITGAGDLPAEELVKEVLALTLSVGYDKVYQDFCVSEAPLESLEISEGDFEGWKIAQILDEANTLLGGCATGYSSTQVTRVIRRINENFAGGEVDGGFLRCPSGQL